ncbi:MAG: hypothetical protein ACC613_04045 [Synergistales bacterium]
MRRRAPLLFCAACALVLLGLQAAGAASPSLRTLPSADRALGESLFKSATRRLNEGHFTESLQTLCEALRFDPYLVDFYLLRGTIHSLLGEEAQARKDLERYLEVRPRDPFAIGFKADLEERTAFVREFLRVGPDWPVAVSGCGPMRRDLGLDAASLRRPLRPAWRNGLLAFGDAETGRIWVFRTHGKAWTRVFRGRLGKDLVRVLPGPDGVLLSVYRDGRGLLARPKKDGLERLREWKQGSASLSDAAWISPGWLAVSDRLRKTVRLLDPLDGRILWEWRLPAQNPEPVSLSAAGPLLAVADRKGRAVFLLDAEKRVLRGRIALPGHPRSVEWLNSGTLLVLTEEGQLFSLSHEGTRKQSLGFPFPEAWFLFPDGACSVGVADTRFTRRSRAVTVPKKGFLALRVPAPEGEENPSSGEKPLRTLEGRLVRPLDAGDRPEMILSGVFRGQAAELEVESRTTGGVFPEIPSDWTSMKSLESLRKATGLLLEVSRFPTETGTVARIGRFALANGITLSIRADGKSPCPLELLRLAEMTGGAVVFSEEEARRARGSEVLSLRPGRTLSQDASSPEEREGLVVLGREGGRTIEGNLPFWEACPTAAE